MRLNAEISSKVGVTLFFVGCGALLAWYNARLNEWNAARKADDHTDHSRQHIQALKSRVQRSFIWTIAGVAAVWLVLDLIF